MKNKLFKVEECYLPQTLTLSSFHTSLNKKKSWMWHLHFKVISLQQRKKKNLHKRSIGTSLSPDVGEWAYVYVCEKENWNELIYRDSKWKACQIFLNSQTLLTFFLSLSLLQCASICVHLWQQNSTNLRFITMLSPSLTHLS